MVLGENKLFKLKLWWPAFQEELFVGPLLIQYFLKKKDKFELFIIFFLYSVKQLTDSQPHPVLS